MGVNKIKRLREVLQYFEGYKDTVSDDKDMVEIVTQTQSLSLEGDNIPELLERGLRTIKLKPGSLMVVEVSHDCPGCCHQRPSKKVLFRATK